jgi:hypothetical protein
MSVTPLPVASGPSAIPTNTATLTLRLLPGHEHTWELRTVEFDDGLEVRRYECCGCDDVVFR